MSKKITYFVETLAKEFNLQYKKDFLSYLIVTKEDIVLRNFLGGCPEPDYNKFGGRKEANRLLFFPQFINSKEYIKHKKKPQGCVITKEEFEEEYELAKQIPIANINEKLINLYNKIKVKIEKYGLILVSKATNKEEEHIMNEILLHELIHQLLNRNEIMFQNIKKSLWKWDEGLCVYMDAFLKNEHHKFAKKQKNGSNKLLNIYLEYAHKWYKLLESADSPKSRKERILKKYLKLSPL